MRDWTQTLWPASFRGVSFWALRDLDLSGQRVAITPLPGGTWDLEDLGAMPGVIRISGYTVGDDADVEVHAIKAACNFAGASVLVLPGGGPVQARCITFEIARERNSAGRFGFEARFAVEPSAVSVMPAGYLAQLAFDAVSSLASAAPAFLNGARL